LKRGAVYRCYCTQEEVRARVHAVTDDGTEYFVYDGRCRDRTDQPDQPFVLRMRVPRDRDEVVVEDLIHGTLRFPLSAIDDFVIVRSDGSAMYNFTVVVDDAEMRISHVIRGDDHIINTPRQVLIYEAAGYTLPQFAHIPLILGRDGKKLSKRDAATAAIDYKDLGYLSDALCNYLVRLGWAHGDREVIHRDELVQLFSLDQVGAKAALFDPAKLLWMNSVYIKEAAPEMLVHYMTHDIDAGFRTACSVWSDERLYAALRLYRDRCKTLVELRDAILSLVHRPAPEAVTTALTDTQKKALRTLITRISECTEDNIAGLKELITSTAQEYQLPFSDLAHPLRKALTGTTAAPGVADLISVVGVEEAIKRITTLLNVL
jgi:glutamyl-tRNA synthetase